MKQAKILILVITAGLLGLASGCAKAKVEPTVRAGNFSKPDMIVVNNFAVDPNDVQLDRGLLAKTMRDDGNRTPNAEEMQVGSVVSEKLAVTLVDELRQVGIPAVRPSPAIKLSPTTVILKGEFLTVDQGNQTERVWVGFGLGGSELKTRIQAIQNGQLLAQADTRTKSSLKPGMLVSAGASAAAETGTAVAVGAATTGLNEAFFATVEADARRTAKEVAKKIENAYKERGWLP